MKNQPNHQSESQGIYRGCRNQRKIGPSLTADYADSADDLNCACLYPLNQRNPRSKILLPRNRRKHAPSGSILAEGSDPEFTETKTTAPAFSLPLCVALRPLWVALCSLSLSLLVVRLRAFSPMTEEAGRFQLDGHGARFNRRGKKKRSAKNVGSAHLGLRRLGAAFDGATCRPAPMKKPCRPPQIMRRPRLNFRTQASTLCVSIHEVCGEALGAQSRRQVGAPKSGDKSPQSKVPQRPTECIGEIRGEPFSLKNSVAALPRCDLCGPKIGCIESEGRS